MASVAEIFETMEYGPAPESDKEALAWLGKHERVVRPLHRRRVDQAAAQLFDVINPATAQGARARRRGHARPTSTPR